MGSAYLIKNWSVENLATWFFTNILMNILSTPFLNIKIVKIRICDHFADWLHRKLALIVSKLSELAINGAEWGSEPFRACPKKTWNIRRNFTTWVFSFLINFDLLVTRLKVFLEVRELGDYQLILNHSLDKALSMKKIFELLKVDRVFGLFAL